MFCNILHHFFDINFFSRVGQDRNVAHNVRSPHKFIDYYNRCKEMFIYVGPTNAVNKILSST